jgi:hypothetical protein
MSEEHTRLMGEQLEVLRDIKSSLRTLAILVFSVLCVLIIAASRAGLGSS